jgi:uncharacterized protein GlcG (DUF336 family)
MTVAALDARGMVVALKAEDGSSLLRPQIASGKAWSALAMGFGTRNLAGRADQLPAFFGALSDLAQGRVLPVPGGVLVRDEQGASSELWERAGMWPTMMRPASSPG